MNKLGHWQSDEELFSTIRQELFTCVVGDAMDKMGLRHQFLPPQIRPLRPDMILIGRAMPVLAVDVFEERVAGTNNKLMERAFGLMLEALDDLKPNEVYINTGSSPCSALWGELMSIRARQLGAAGAVLNGYLRDTKAVLNLNFPAFCWGSYAQDSGPRYKVVDYRIAIEIEAVRVRPGDYLLGDIDGVCVIPVEAATEVFSKALEKARGEKLVRKRQAAGTSPGPWRAILTSYGPSPRSRQWRWWYQRSRLKIENDLSGNRSRGADACNIAKF
jgi:regulator of RNase E activity RraA